MKGKLVHIKHCSDCPYHVEYGELSECSEMSLNIVIRGKRNFPTWCPLEDEEDEESKKR